MKNPKLTLGTTYYLLIILALVAALAGFKMMRNGFTMSPDTAFVFYNVMIWYVIITLPAALTLFRYATKNLRKTEDTDRRDTLYIRYALARMLVIGIGLIASVLLFYLTNTAVVEGAKKNMSLFWLAGIEAIGLVFCKPTEKRINRDLGDDEDPQPDNN